MPKIVPFFLVSLTAMCLPAGAQIQSSPRGSSVIADRESITNPETGDSGIVTWSMERREGLVREAGFVIITIADPEKLSPELENFEVTAEGYFINRMMQDLTICLQATGVEAQQCYSRTEFQDKNPALEDAVDEISRAIGKLYAIFLNKYSRQGNIQGITNTT